MTPDAAGIEAALAAGLAAHADCLLNGEDGPGAVTSGVDTWSCGLTLPFVDDLEQAERAHVAAALLPVVTQAQAAERERIAQALQRARGLHWMDRDRAARIARADESGGES